jgi:2-iminobutanoate/2-iminopropanoate deaminase
LNKAGTDPIKHRELNMPIVLNPPNVAAPSSSYSHGILIAPNAKRLVISGQIGVRPDGSIAEGMKAQTEQAIDNLFNIVAAAGMKPTDIVKIVTYVTKADNIARGTIRQIRNPCPHQHTADYRRAGEPGISGRD